MARLQPAKLEAALDAANKRVLAADKQVANAATNLEFDRATDALLAAVQHLETVASCAKRCAMVAHTLAAPWESNSSDGERERKRMRLEAGAVAGLPPATLALAESATQAAADGVDGDEVDREAKEDGLE